MKNSIKGIRKNNIRRRVITILLIVITAYMFLNSLSLLGLSFRKYDRIEIRNGTTGSLYVLEGNDTSEFIKGIRGVKIKICGLNDWAFGYSYKIELFKRNTSREIFIKSSYLMTKGLFKYEPAEDMIALVERLMTRYSENKND